MSTDETSANSIQHLPDYPTLKKLAAALWRQDNAYHGAAIMVGAGFSRSAASTGDAYKKLPLWNDLSKILAKDLDARANSDPLRLAEEYCAYFGKQALQELVKREINDISWKPGVLYENLLKLPWSEVLTTNWDTLLERASLSIHQPFYNVVNRQEDLSSARSPRIVKLHGTVNVTDHLIFTQEDYRTYPQNHAAFVNFSRQVFIENELCLLGFSGDDPNFLQWAGWVRDHLAANARRIYLVGALNLTAAKRKYLESINVAPIDLGDLVSTYDDRDRQHLEAIKIFLETLKSLKPNDIWEWTPSSLDRSESAELQLEKLQKDRASYPGWVICPYNIRWQHQMQIHNMSYLNSEAFSKIAPGVRAKLLYEIAWRCSITHEVFPHWLIDELLAVANPQTTTSIKKHQQLELALIVLKNTRWIDDENKESIINIASNILETEAKHWPDATNELAYHNALVARDRFDYPNLEKNIEKIQAVAPIWKLRKSSLLAELGKFDDGETLISEAHRTLLGQYRNDQNSVSILSRLAIASWLLHGVTRGGAEKLPSKYRDWKCDLWDHLDHMSKQILKSLDLQENQKGILPLFEPGHYKDNSSTHHFTNEVHPALVFEGIANDSGIPIRWFGVSLLTDQASKLANLDDLEYSYRFALAIRSAHSDSTVAREKILTRTQISLLPQKDIDRLIDQCIEAIGYWRARLSNTNKKEKEKEKENNFAIERLRVFMEVLARTSIRAAPSKAGDIFRLAAEFGSEPRSQHPWLYESLGHLLKYSLESIPLDMQEEYFSDAIHFPLKNETKLHNPVPWPNPIVSYSGKRDARISRRISEIIDQISPNSEANAPALLRLLPLIKSGFLSEIEKETIAEKIWANSPNHWPLPETGLFTYVLLELPHKNTDETRKAISNYLFNAPDEKLFEPAFLQDVRNASTSPEVKLRPNNIEASLYFQRLINWRPNTHSKGPFGGLDQTQSRIASAIGGVVSRSIVPALPRESITKENFQNLYSFIMEVDSPETIIALPYFANTDPSVLATVETTIKKWLRSTNTHQVAYSSYAILIWREMENSPLIEGLILALISLIASTRAGLAALIWTANELYKKGFLSKINIESLIEITPIIFDNVDYPTIESSSREAVSASLVRASCVRLARDLIKGQASKNEELIRVLNDAKIDPLPEVRFSEDTEAE